MADTAQTTSAYDVDAIRADFPILAREIYGKPLVYLDNGASAQKPRAVIDAVSHTYENEYANVHRGLHFLSYAATDAYEKAMQRALIQYREPKNRQLVRKALEKAGRKDLIGMGKKCLIK